MSIKHNGSTIAVSTVTYKDGAADAVDVKQLKLDGTYTWCKPYTYTQGALPTGVASLTCTRHATSEPDSSTGTVANGGTIYHGDELYWTATASAGYNNPTLTYYDSSHLYTVTGNVVGVSASGLTAGLRINWKLTVTMGNYVTGWRYKIDSGSWVNKTASFTITGIDYASKVTIEGTAKEGATGYTYGSYQGTGTFGSGAQSSDLSTTLSCSKTRISGTISQGTLPTGVASITCYRKAWDGSSFSTYTGSAITYGDQFYWTATASTGYNNPTLTYYDSSHVYTWTGSQGGSITSVSASGVAAGSRKSFTITLAKAASHDYFDWKNGSTTVTSMTAYYGDIILVSGNVVTCKKWDATSTNRWQVTATAYANTAQYSYSTPTVTPTTEYTVTAAATYTGSNDRTLKSYIISFTNPTYGSWGSASKTAYYGDVISKSGTTVTCYQGSSSTSRWTNTVSANSQTDQWSYTTPTVGDITSPVTGAQTVSASNSRNERSYNVTFTNGSYGSWNSTTAISATYSTQITISGNTVTVGSTSRTYTRNSNTAQYTYGNTVKVGGSTTTPQTVGTGKAVTSTDTRTVNPYAVSITKGTGISSVYLSTTNTATSGDASGTTYAYGTTVYAFAVLGEHYDIPSGSNWVLVSGTADATGSKYRVGSVSITGAHNFGTINAAIEKYNLSITKGTGVSTIYYKVNGASSYSNTTSNLSVSVNDLSTYYYYATASSYYGVNSDCGTSSSPKSGTVNCANISTSVSATPYKYSIQAYSRTGGTVYWSTSSITTSGGSTTLADVSYGTTVYWRIASSTGYTLPNPYYGSMTLNSTNFTLSSTTANGTATYKGSAIPNCTRITWKPTVTLGTGVTNFVYSLDGGTTWSSAVTSWPSNVNVDYAGNVKIKVNAVSDYYILDSTTVYNLIYASPTYTLAAQPKTYSLYGPFPAELLYGPGPGSGGTYTFYNAASGGSIITSAAYNSTVFLQFTPSTDTQWKSVSTPSSRYTVQVTPANFSIENDLLSATYKTIYQTRKSATIVKGTLPANITSITTHLFSDGLISEEASYSTYPITIYYGQKLYFSAVCPSTSYDRLWLQYNSTNFYFQWTGNDGDTVTATEKSQVYPGHSFSQTATNCTLTVTRTFNGRTSAFASDTVDSSTILFDNDQLTLSATPNATTYGSWSYNSSDVTPIEYDGRYGGRFYYKNPSSNAGVKGLTLSISKIIASPIFRSTQPTASANWNLQLVTNPSSITVKADGSTPLAPAASTYYTLSTTERDLQLDTSSSSSYPRYKPANWYLGAFFTPLSARTVTAYTMNSGSPTFTSGATFNSGDGYWGVNGTGVVVAAAEATASTSSETRQISSYVYPTPRYITMLIPVYLTAGTGITQVYWSTSRTATSGSISGACTNISVTRVCAFAKLDHDYAAPSGWTLVSGTANSYGAIYRVDEVAVSSNVRFHEDVTEINFGTINATRKPNSVTVTVDNTGRVSQIDLIVNGKTKTITSIISSQVVGYVSSTDTVDLQYVTADIWTTYTPDDIPLNTENDARGYPNTRYRISQDQAIDPSHNSTVAIVTEAPSTALAFGHSYTGDWDLEDPQPAPGWNDFLPKINTYYATSGGQPLTSSAHGIRLTTTVYSWYITLAIAYTSNSGQTWSTLKTYNLPKDATDEGRGDYILQSLSVSYVFGTAIAGDLSLTTDTLWTCGGSGTTKYIYAPAKAINFGIRNNTLIINADFQPEST